MQLSVIQIILAIIASYFLLNRTMRFMRKERTQTGFKLITTCIVWGGVLFTSLFPTEVHNLSRRLGFGENLNTLIFFGFVVVFIVLFKLLSSIEKLEKSLTDIKKRSTEGFI